MWSAYLKYFRFAVLAVVSLLVVASPTASAPESAKCALGCSSHGTCFNGACECDAGWVGTDCSFFLEGAEASDPQDLSVGVMAACPAGCSGHGACSNGACRCDAGFEGEQCEMEKRCPEACRPPQGTCVLGTCSCVAGFVGVSCDEKQCPDDCWGNGVCEEGHCRCSQGWTGSSCNHRSDGMETCDPVCSEHGICSNGGCHCASGFSGVDCSHRTSDMTIQGLGHSESFVGFIAGKTAPRGAQVPRLSLAQQPKMGELEKKAELDSQTPQDSNLAQSTTDFDEIVGGTDSLPNGTIENASNVSHNRLAREIGTLFTQDAVASWGSAYSRMTRRGDLDFEDAVSREENRSARARARGSSTGVLLLRRGVLINPGLINEAPVTAAGTTALLCEANCSGHGQCSLVANVPVCACQDGWAGMLCDMQRCPDDCNSRGICIAGRCECQADFFGDSCAHQHCPNNCGGRGYCFAGTCACLHGFKGAGCEEVDEPPAMVSLKLKKKMPPRGPEAIDAFSSLATLRGRDQVSCPDSCNHRGTCQQGECQCWPGYSGIACESYCPNECSRSGVCLEGACLCFAGFFGEDCSRSHCCSGHGSCEDPTICICDAGWGGESCELKLQCADPMCSGHGTCTDGVCHCAVGFEGLTCSSEIGGCSVTCAPNGRCNSKTKTCDCSTGFTGANCSEQVESCPNHCNHRGLCLNGECMCGEGWSGADCSNAFFEPGRKVSDLLTASSAPEDIDELLDGAWSGVNYSARFDTSILWNRSSNASSNDGYAENGGVVVDHSLNRGVVTSHMGYGLGHSGYGGVERSAQNVSEETAAVNRLSAESGEDALICGQGGTCSGNGFCDTAVGKCVCNQDFTGDVCEVQRCPGFSAVGLDCFGHGQCRAGKCQCVAGYGPPSNCSAQVCDVDCGEHGHCGSNGTCLCNLGWKGETCSDPECPLGCSGHGECTFASAYGPGECTCEYGFAGAGCERQALYTQLRSCANDCSGNGLCLDGRCACNVGFTGADCSEPACAQGLTGPRCNTPTCPNDCSGKGMCWGGQCACWEAFLGEDCSLPKMCLDPCRQACAAGVMAESCRFCVGHCSAAMGHSVLGAHSPFDDLKYTLLQAPTNSMLIGIGSATQPQLHVVTGQRRHHQHHEVFGGGTSESGRHHRRHHEEVAMVVEKGQMI